ncbi:hypothetical protein [Nemorincola caseinilytica]|uniref:hypothetical protein n=1 Tax=Nemorincola caseinilytica TaxID=2054315 RepID=UPI0031E7BB95
MLLLTHVPPVGIAVRVVVVPTQISVLEISGKGCTVTVVTLEHPVDVCVYEIRLVPTETAVTMPVLDPTVAIDVALLVHVPPVVAEDNVVVAPIHTDRVPVIVAGAAITVTIAVLMQPNLLYVILAVPAPTPVATPVDALIVATPVLLLLHVPPEGVQERELVLPSQKDIVPVIGPGT